MSAEAHDERTPRPREEFVQYEVADGVATIWLNRPEVKNCVNWGLLTQLGAALERAEDDDDVRVVLIRGRGAHVLRRRRPQHARLRVPRHDEQLGEDRAGLGAHVRPRVQPGQADDRGRRGLRRRRRLRADDLVRLRHRRRRRQDRRLPHPPRAVRRRRPDLPPAALHRPAQDQGAAASPASCCPARSARTGAWPTCRRRPRSSSRRSPTSSRR